MKASNTLLVMIRVISIFFLNISEIEVPLTIGVFLD